MKKRTVHIIRSGVSRQSVRLALGGIGLVLEEVFGAGEECTYSENWWRPDHSLLVVHSDSTYFTCDYLAVTGEPADVDLIRDAVACDTLHELIQTARSAPGDHERLLAIYRLGLACYESSSEAFDLFLHILTSEQNPVLRGSVLSAFTQHVLPEWYDLAVLATRDQDATVRRDAANLLPLF